MPEFDIVSIGECLVELYSEKSFADTEIFRKDYGGDTITVLVAASRLGSRTGYITRVGEDHFAPFLLQGWLNERIDLSLVKVIPGLKNGVCFDSAFSGGGHNTAYYREGSAASTLSVDDIKTEYVAAGKCLHVSGVSQALSMSSRDMVYEACRLVKENKTGEVSYDPHYRSGLWPVQEAKVAFQEILPFVDILFLKHPFESEELIGIEDPDALIKALWQQGVRVVALKTGKQGCIVGERHSRVIGRVEAFNAGGVVDRTGSGDVFCGAFLHGITRGYDIFQAAWLGNIMAALKMRRHGTIAALPKHNDVYQVFEAA